MNKLREGLTVQISGQQFRVLKYIPDREATLLNERTSSVKTISFEKINEYLISGILKISQDQDVIIRGDGLPPIPSALPEKHRKELVRRLKYVQRILAETTTFSKASHTKPIISAVAKALDDVKPPSDISAYRWCRQYLKSGEDIMSLSPKTAGCGRRIGQVSDKVTLIFFDVIDQYFLTTAKLSRIKVHAILVDEILLFNTLAEKKDSERPLSFNAFCKWIREKVDPFVLMLRRDGVAQANRYFRSRQRGPSALFPMERVEMDHTVLDILIVHPITGVVLGRPTCTVAIDRRTRVVLAIYIDLAPPSSIAVLMCLQQAMQSKIDILTRIGCEQFLWPCGRIQQVCLDNGMEFHGQYFKRFSEDLAIDIQYCPPGKPWYKGAVERFLWTLATGLIHSLPGTTRSNPKDRGNYPSEKMASLTLDQLRDLVWKWIVIEYHQRRHSELGMSPIECWNQLIQEHPVPTVNTTLTLELENCLSFEVNVNNGRVKSKGLVYEHPYLVHLQETLHDNEKTMLRINPSDVTQAYLYEPINKSLISLKCITEMVEPGMSWLNFQSLRKEQKQNAETESEEVRKARVDLIKECHDLHMTAERILKSKSQKKAIKTSRIKKKAEVLPVTSSPSPNEAGMKDDDWIIGSL